MAAVKKVLGDAATEDVCAAWTEAYGFLASLFISTEKAIREARAAAPGGWEGWRNFVVKEKVKESDEIVSLHLTPQDGGPLPLFKPGQVCQSHSARRFARANDVCGVRVRSSPSELTPSHLLISPLACLLVCLPAPLNSTPHCASRRAAFARSATIH